MTNFDLLSGDCGALIAFNLFVKHGGAGLAAKVTGLGPMLFTGQITHLEERLGVKLVERHAPRVRLTGSGMDLHLRTEAHCDAITRELKKHHAHAHRAVGPLVVSAPAVFAQTFPYDHYRSRFPEVDLQFTDEERFDDVYCSGVDAVIRVDAPATPSNEMPPPLSGSTLLVASPHRSRPEHAFARSRLRVKDFPMVDEFPQLAVKVREVGDGGLRTYHLSQKWTMLSLLGVREMVRNGGEPALLPHALVAEDLNDGSLVMWGVLVGPRKPVWAFRPGRGALSPALSGFSAFLLEHYGPEPAFTVFV